MLCSGSEGSGLWRLCPADEKRPRERQSESYSNFSAWNVFIVLFLVDRICCNPAFLSWTVYGLFTILSRFFVGFFIIH